MKCLGKPWYDRTKWNDLAPRHFILFYRITAYQGISFCSIVLRLAKAFHFVLSYYGLPRHFILFYRIPACQGISFCSIVLRLTKAFHFVLSYYGLPRHFILFYRITACQDISFCSIVLRLAKAFHFVLSYYCLPRHFILFYRIPACLVISFCSRNHNMLFPHSWIITGFLTRLKLRMPLVEQHPLRHCVDVSAPL
jgi:hypothetical protein